MAFQFNSKNPLVSVLNVIGLVLFVAIAATLGLLVLAVVLGLMAIAAGALSVQRYRFRRQQEKSGSKTHSANDSSKSPEVIDGEYRVIEVKDKDKSS